MLWHCITDLSMEGRIMQDIKEMLSGREETAFAFSVEDRYIVI